MKKIFKGMVCLGLCGVLGFGAAGCSKSEHRNPETDALKLAISAVDGNFNPLFYTSMNDGEIASMTQVGLISTDSEGNFSYGNDFPTVALNYKETYYTSDNSVAAYGDGKGVYYRDGYNASHTNSDGSTSYEFVIKNGIKFSDGVHDLTVMDVLFNLYVYLDPVYSGSSTIYSTKIKGLQAYRQQVRGADGVDNGNSSMSQEYYGRAIDRINDIIDWTKANSNEEDASEQMKADFAKIKQYYKEELESDWNSANAGFAERYKEYRFTESWEGFYYDSGMVENRTEMLEGSNVIANIKDSNGKYVTTLDYNDAASSNPDDADNKYRYDLVEGMEAATSETEINKFLAEHSDYTRENAILELQKQEAIKTVANRLSATSGYEYVLTYTATASRILEFFIADEMSVDIEGELDIPNIEGITVRKSDKFTDARGNEINLGEEHDILKVEIYGVDPKAKWNFGFTVAPMYYYSDGVNSDGTENTNSVYYKAAMESYRNGTVYTSAAKDFGVKYRNIDWLSDVAGAEWKNKVPMGAGAYRCCTNRWSTDGVTGSNFLYNNTTYFARNDYFTTMGTGIDNAKIKYVTYTVTPDDKIVESLQSRAIDYGTPTATAQNQTAVQDGTLEQIDYLTGGYGYVGINPKYVPDIEVRRAIMHAFDTAWVTQYYGKTLVSLINRPMSITSWAYPENSTRFYERWTESQEIIKLVESSGNWTYDERAQKLVDANGTPLKLTFTIAGETTDHPAFRMFVAAEAFLETCGFEVSVETRADALQRLVSGDLAVWAAAWSSSIDPDPYQIYSINSNASSTKNWYKDGIMNDATGTYDEERAIAEALEAKIQAGRQTLNQSDREEIYGKLTKIDDINNVDLSKLCTLDLVMMLAVEFPTYQRKDLCVYNPNVLEASSMHLTDASYHISPLGELWKVEFKK